MRWFPLCGLGLLALAAALPAPARAEPLALTGAGASFPAPLYQRLAEDFQAHRPGVTLSYASVGSGEGLARFLADAVDFGASDQPPSPQEAARAAHGLVLVPATAGMVVVAYNLPGLQGELRLPADATAGIFAGRIRFWDDPALTAANPGLKLPHRSIAVVVRQEASGTTAAFTRALAAASPLWREAHLGAARTIAWPGAVMKARGNEAVSARLRISDWSIGYVEYGFAERLGLPMAALENAAGSFVRPSRAAGTAALAGGADPATPLDRPAGAQAYPIVTYSWLLLRAGYDDPARAAALRAFVAFGLGEGQTTAAALGYIPLPPAVTQAARASLDRVR